MTTVRTSLLKFGRALVCITALGFAVGPPAAAAPALTDYLIVSNREGDILRFERESGAFAGTVARRGENGLNVAAGMALGPDGLLYVESVYTELRPYPPGEGPRILKYDVATGAFRGVFAEQPLGAFEGPYFRSIAFGPDGDLYAGDGSFHDVYRFDGENGAFKGVFARAPSGANASGLSWGSDGDLYVTMGHGNITHVFDGHTGTLLRSVAASQTAYASINGNEFGPDGLLYVGDYFGGDIDVYDVRADAASSFVRSIPGLQGVNGMSFDTDGTLFAAVYFDNGIAKVAPGAGSGGSMAWMRDRSELRGPFDIVLVSTPAVPGIPEPATAWLSSAGLLLIAAALRRRRPMDRTDLT